MENFDINEVASQLDAGTFDQAPTPTPEGGQPGQPGQGSSFDPNMLVTYKASGKDLSEPLSTVIQRAQRGYDYAQLVQQHKQRESELQTQQQRISEMESQWKPYHEYASQNPEWANYLKQNWESRFNWQGQQQATPQNEFAQGQQQQQGTNNLPPEVAQKIAKMEQFIAQQEQQQQLAERAAQDNALAQEIESIRKTYPDIDFSHTNPETGESLESQILRHAQENRIYNYQAAFKDFYFDKLMERNVMQAKESAAKQMTQQHKTGFLASSDKPLLTHDQPGVNTKLSYHSLMDIAAKELGF
jgi:hypothetical protein